MTSARTKPVWYTTKVRGENGKLYDLGKLQFLPEGVMAVNAWTEPVEDL